MAYKWVQSSAYSSIPEEAVVGGNDEDGAMIYVGRAEHEGDMMVCKVVPSKQIGFISNRGEALPKDIFEMLCGQNLVWVKCYDHVIPETAVLCGRSSLDQAVYIGRGHYEGHLIIGKISSVHRALFIAFRGAERRLDSYEILVEERRVVPGWQLPPPPPPEELEKCPLTPPPPPSPPAPAPPVAEKALGKYTYPHLAAMPFPRSDRPPAYTPTPDPLPPLPVGGIFVPPPPHAPPPGGVFVMPPVRPQPPPPPAPPTPSFYPAQVAPAAISVAPSFTPAETYRPPMGSYGAAGTSYTPAEYAPMAYEVSSSSSYGYESNYDVWVTAGPGYFYSADAVIGGHDSNMAQLLVCRAYYAGVHVPGKAIPSQGCAYIAHGGREIVEPTYQVLLGQGKYHWVRAHEGSIAPGAVMAGRAPGGEPLYIGRAHYCGSLTPGVLQQSNRCLQIPFGGQEIRISSYEVLVRSDLYHSQQAMLLVY
ncbi:cell wall adhesin EAP1 [Drosophila madeirensis]|uniref:Cell wall adhesin EAP1 n=1 Tax=Drosophila madeirensis TaxID=30013 RepID=A0AAU9GCJ3_DROMD